MSWEIILLFILLLIIISITFVLHLKGLKWKINSDKQIKKIINQELKEKVDYITNIYEPNKIDYNPLKIEGNSLGFNNLEVFEKTYYRVINYRKDGKSFKKWLRIEYNIFKKIKLQFSEDEEN